MNLRQKSYAVIEEQAERLMQADPTLSPSEARLKFLETEQGKIAGYVHCIAVSRGEQPAKTVTKNTVVNDRESDRIWDQIEKLAVEWMVRNPNTDRKRPSVKAEAIAAVVAQHPDLYARYASLVKAGR